MGHMTQSAILPETLPNFTDLRNSFTSKLSDKCAKLKCLAALSCDFSSITIHISDCRHFSDIHISQGTVATYFRCGGIFKDYFVANLRMSLPVKEF